jgi:hypothetical protein
VDWFVERRPWNSPGFRVLSWHPPVPLPVAVEPRTGTYAPHERPLLGAVSAVATWTGRVEQTAGLLTNGTFKPVKFPLTAVPFAGDIAF